MPENENILQNFENIELALPLNAAYISVAKQTAFAIAGRLGFDAQESDDIKTAVSESCAYIVKKLAGGAQTYKINFSMSNDHVVIRISCASSELSDAEGGSLMLIRKLMDHMDIQKDGGMFEIVMSKRLLEGFY